MNVEKEHMMHYCHYTLGVTKVVLSSNTSLGPGFSWVKKVCKMACFKLGSGFHFHACQVFFFSGNDACQVLKRRGRWMVATLLVLVDERMLSHRWWFL